MVSLQVVQTKEKDPCTFRNKSEETWDFLDKKENKDTDGLSVEVSTTTVFYLPHPQGLSTEPLLDGSSRWVNVC